MSDNKGIDTAPTVGRGRGRGDRDRVDPAARATSSSTSEKQSMTEGNGNGNGNGARRGTTRGDQNIAVGFHRTTPLAPGNSKQGVKGKKVTLCANYFRLERKPDFEFVLYRVDITPECDQLNLRKAFVGKQRAVLGGYLFDGQHQLYLTHRLPNDQMVFNVQSLEGKDYTLIIKYTGTTISMTGSEANQVLNLILRRTMGGLKMQLVGRNLYDPDHPVCLKDFFIELWPGYVTSIRQHENDILVCAEVSHKVMRNESIYEILREHRISNSPNWQDNFRKEIIGSIVLTRYNNKTYRVDDVDFKSSPESKFNQKGVEVSYVDYYKERYNITIVDRKQPMLCSNPKPRDVRDGRNQVLFLVPELCRATGLTDKMRSNFNMMRAMAEHTQMDPERRVRRLMEFTTSLNTTPECREILENFHAGVSRELVEIPGRALIQESIRFGGEKVFQNDDKVDWTNHMKLNEMFHSVNLTRWAFVYPMRCERESTDFFQLLKEVANGMNYVMGDPRVFVLRDDRVQTYRTEIENVLSMDPRMIMVVVPNNAGDRYAAIKRMTCVDRAVATQVIVAKTMQPKKGGIGGVKSIATKVLIQLNCKLGGAPWMIKYPLKGAMIIGFDVTHDTNDKSKSYGAFVASMDLQIAVEYYSAVSAHTNGEEMSNNIGNHMVHALRMYYNVHKTLPAHIFFYRDGVGDGQIEYVHTTELARLNEKVQAIYKKAGNGLELKLSFIIVNKRLNTRFFSKTKSGNTFRYHNPVPGTIVDNTVTLPERYDFFLVSQSVRQGTVAPTSYNIIHDTNGLTPDQMQQLTYKLTHLYYNWSGTTRVPAPVQYAHKLAFLVGQHLHQPPNPGFQRNLYFL